jgi:hypothetical protein
MTGTCEECGGDVENKNSAGHYRDKCESCIEEIAAGIDTERPPCERDCPNTAIGPNDAGEWLCTDHMVREFKRHE